MAMNYLASGNIPVRNGTASQITCPWQTFEAADKSIMIAVGNDMQFERLVHLLGLEGLEKDSRFHTNLDRVKNAKVLIPLLSEKIVTQTAAYWEEKLEKIGIPSGQINNFEEVFEDAQIKHRNVKQTMMHETAGEIDIIANPIKFSETEIEYRLPPPVFAAHTDEVLKERLNMDQAQLNALRDKGVIC